MFGFGAGRLTTLELVDGLSRSLGPRLRTALLYGSVIAGDFERDSSDLNLLLVISPLGIAELETIEPLVSNWKWAGKRMPELFTPEQLLHTLDAFAIEWHDIHQARKLLHGDDPFVGIAIPTAPMRLQLEREMNAFVLSLRERFVAARGDEKRIMRVMTDSVVPLLVLVRALLRLHSGNGNVPARKVDSLAELAGRLGFDPDSILTVLRVRQKKERAPSTGLNLLFSNYLGTAEFLLGAVDRIVVQP